MPLAQNFHSVNWRIFAYFLAVPIITFLTLTLTGCVTASPGLPNLHLLEVSLPYRNGPSAPKIRIGYFGMCVGNAPNFACSNSDSSSPSDMISKLKLGPKNSTEGHISVESLDFALTLQKKMFPPLLAASGSIFALGIFALLLLQRDVKAGEQVVRGTSAKALNPKRTERYRKAATLSFCISTALALASAVAVAQTASGIQYTTRKIASGSLSTAMLTVNAGIPSQTLHWLISAFLATFTVSMLSIFNEPFFKTHRNPYLKPEPDQTASLPNGAPPVPAQVGAPMPFPPMAPQGPIFVPPQMR